MNKKSCFFVVLMMIVSLLAGCTSTVSQLMEKIKKPEITGLSPHITGLDLEGVEVSLDMAVNNPYPVAIKSPEMKLVLDIMGKEFLNSTLSSGLNLPASGTGNLNIPLKLKYADLFNIYQELKGAKETTYAVRGSLSLPVMDQKFDIPFKTEGRIPIFKLPKIEDIKVNFGKPSLLDGAEISATAKLTNPNICAIGVQGLGYNLSLGDVTVGDITAMTGSSIEPDASDTLTLKGKISALNTIQQLLGGQSLGTPKVNLIGAIETPYGKINLK